MVIFVVINAENQIDNCVCIYNSEQCEEVSLSQKVLKIYSSKLHGLQCIWWHTAI